MKFNRRELILFIILIVLGMGVVFYQFFYLAQQKEMDSVKAELDANRLKLEQLTAGQGEAEKDLKKIEALDIKISSIDRKIPGIKDVPGTLVEFYYLLRENSLQGKSISFSKITKDSKYDFYTISFSAEGARDNIYKFIQQIENHERLYSINSINLSTTGTGVSADFNLKAYLAKGSQEQEPEDYNFMQGKYGTFSQVFDMFQN